MMPEAWGDETHDSTGFVARREQIFVHAAQMFCTRGFAATSMADIAEAVGITKAGLYHFVRNKEAQHGRAGTRRDRPDARDR
jgi:AcrR family transcriptional regulator